MDNIYRVEFDEGYHYIKAPTYGEAANIFRNLFSNKIENIYYVNDFEAWRKINLGGMYIDRSDVAKKQYIEDNKERCNQLSDWLKDNQHCIPTRLEYLAESSPNVKWNQAKKLYKNAVRAVCNIHNVDFLTDIDYNKGFEEVVQYFEQFLMEAENASADR